MDQFANMIHIEFRDYPAGIRVDQKQLTLLQYRDYIAITDMRDFLLSVVLLNSLQVLKSRTRNA